ncbi:MAG: Wzz/FepE/Etk N-terminal domain-containing protein [Burkholderiaceae bacterium]|jgi:tyrosine-protein kinase Etk/Wzc
MPDTVSTDAVVSGPQESQQESSLLDIMIALGEEKWILFFTPLLVAAFLVALSFVITPIFTARTVMLPPQQQQSAATAALSNLGALGGLAGAAAGVKSPDELYSAFLKSDSIKNALVTRFKLKEHFDVKTLTEAKARLTAKVRVISDKKTGLISIEVDDPDPSFAAALANAHIEELRKVLARLAVTEAQQRRMFLEQQLNLVRDRVALAEVRLRDMQERSGVLSLDAQAQGAIRATVELRSQIAQREVQLGAMRTFATTQNVEVQRLSAEIAQLRAQLNKLESGSGQSEQGFKGVETVRAYRELKYQEAIMDALVRQFELAKVDEAREGPLLQQLDVALVPERKSKPKRLLMLLGGLVGGLILGILIAVLRRFLKKTATDQASALAWTSLKRAWSLKA